MCPHGIHPRRLAGSRPVPHDYLVLGGDVPHTGDHLARAGSSSPHVVILHVMPHATRCHTSCETEGSVVIFLLHPRHVITQRHTSSARRHHAHRNNRGHRPNHPRMPPAPTLCSMPTRGHSHQRRHPSPPPRTHPTATARSASHGRPPPCCRTPLGNAFRDQSIVFVFARARPAPLKVAARHF